ncbi:hypothetical protein DPV78_002195 [Talaromyces pinophilus]|nr:hypothetical protein DPV78_002195 [Talaromyces pinophilus]
MLIAIHDTGHHRVGICARANSQEEDEEERLEVEEGGLFKVEVSCLVLVRVRMWMAHDAP